MTAPVILAAACSSADTTKWLAQLVFEGDDCSFNVWSNLGGDHLEHLLASLRFVDA